MKEIFSDNLGYSVNCILMDGKEISEDSLERSVACFAAAMEPRRRDENRMTRHGELLASFRYVAAAVCLRQMDRMPAVGELFVPFNGIAIPN
jgi:hypothetical protein